MLFRSRAAQALVEDLGRVHRQLTASVVTADPGSDIERIVDDLAARRGAELQAFRSVLADLSADGRPTLAGLIIAVREMESLIEG